MAVKVLTDSTSYIPESIQNQLDIKIVSLSVTFKDESFREADIDNKKFYKKMDEKGIPKSSQPSIEEMYIQMEDVIKRRDDLLCIFLSSDMSGTYSTANMVKSMVLDKYNYGKIEIIDSRSNCMQLGFAAVVAARAAREGKSLSNVKRIAEENIVKSRFLFIPDNLEYLKKGGRIGGASALIGNLLKIIPILTVKNGKTTVLTKVRTKKKAIMAMIEKTIQDINNYGLGEIVVHHINCLDEALELVGKLKNILNIDIGICDIGPVIGLHVGPGAIGIVYYSERELDQNQ